MSGPSLEQLRKSARDLLTAFHADDPLARKRVTAHLPGFARSATDLQLTQAQFVVARENGYPSWPKLKAAAESGTAASRTGPSGAPSAWRTSLVRDAARQAAESAQGRDVEGLLRAVSLLPLRDLLVVRQILVEAGAYPTVVEALIAGLELPQARLRFESAHLMDHFADERCIEPLLRLLDDQVPRVRRMALHSLSCDACKLAPLEQQTDFVALAIERAFNDPSIQVRRHAVTELSMRRQDPRAMAALQRIRAEESDERMRRACSRVLGRL